MERFEVPRQTLGELDLIISGFARLEDPSCNDETSRSCQCNDCSGSCAGTCSGSCSGTCSGSCLGTHY